MTNELKASEQKIALYLEAILTSAMEGDLQTVKKFAKRIHQLAQKDKVYVKETKDKN